MTIAHDIYSETNPAYCTYALAAFVTAFISVNSDGPELANAYVSIPIALSGDLCITFNGTNKNTGLLEWIERSPRVQIGLASRLNESFPFVTEGIRLGCFTGALILEERAQLRIGQRKLKQAPVKTLGEDSRGVIKRAERLGYWFAAAGPTRTIFELMGLIL
jgi:hypothetical protein